jgi:TRAP-type C4-dicarboxylate transport system substrate-binding protein
MVNATGALLMNKAAFDRLSPENREIVRRMARHYSSKLVQLTRRDNDEAIQVLREAGIALIPPTPEQMDSFRRSAEKNYERSIPSLYSRDLYEKIRGLISEYRATVK